MMRKLLASFVLTMTMLFGAYGQKYEISGNISFSNISDKPLGVQVYLDSVFIGSTTDFNGNYTIENVPGGSYTLVARYIGYEEYRKRIPVSADVKLNFELEASSVTLESVSVISDRLIDKASVSDISMIAPEIDTYRGLQEDPVNILILMPGITKGDNDLFSSSQLYVRGGAPYENKFLYDNVTVYWPWYSGGIKSVFNNEVIDKLELLTGGFSAKYGDALSSVMRVTTRDGDYNKFGGNFTFGFSGLQATLEGPIVKDKASVLVSVRKTYLDLILGEDASFPTTNIADVTFRAAWKVNEKHKISLSGLSSREKLDFLSFDPEPGMPNEMNTMNTGHNQSLQIQSMWSEKLYGNLSLYHSYAESNFAIGNNLNMDLRGQEIGLREDMTYHMTNRHKLNFGIEAGVSSFQNTGNTPLDPSETDVNDTTIVLRSFDFKYNSQKTGAYISYSGDLTARLSVSAGLRGDFLIFDNKLLAHDLSPRLSLQYMLFYNTAIRASYGHFYQFADGEALASNAELNSNFCTHYIAGIEQKFGSHFNGWIELYFKDYDDLVVYNTSGVMDEIMYSNLGTGYAQGAELFLMRKKGKITSWVSYAYSQTKRQESLQDTEYFFEYDRPHMLNVAGEFKIGQKPSFFIPHAISLQFRYESGNPYTPVKEAIQTEEGWQVIKGETNSERNPDFHNLMFKVIWLTQDTDKIIVKAFFEIWNLYNHRNLLGRNYQYGAEYQNNVKMNEYYSTPLMPSGGVRIEF